MGLKNGVSGRSPDGFKKLKFFAKLFFKKAAEVSEAEPLKVLSLV